MARSDDSEADLLRAEARKYVDVSCIYPDDALRPGPRSLHGRKPHSVIAASKTCCLLQFLQPIQTDVKLW